MSSEHKAAIKRFDEACAEAELRREPRPLTDALVSDFRTYMKCGHRPTELRMNHATYKKLLKEHNLPDTGKFTEDKILGRPIIQDETVDWLWA